MIVLLLMAVVRYPAAAEDIDDNEKPVVAVVLAGGGALGFAHIGVLQVLEEEGVQPDIVVGTSIGSIVGGLYAAGYTPEEIASIVIDTNWHETLFDTARRGRMDFHWKEFQSQYHLNLRLNKNPDVSNAGFSHAQRVVELLDRMLEEYPVEMDFDDLPRRYRAVAADLLTGERIVYDEGDLKTAIRASMSVPGVFAPVSYQGRYAIDGGWVDNIPTEVAREMGADIVIAVPLADEMETDADEISTIAAISEQANRIRVLERTRRSLSDADLVIAPNLRGYSMADFESGEDLIALGYDAANARRAAIGEVLRLQGRQSVSERKDSEPSQIAIASVTVNGGDERLEDLRTEVLEAIGEESTPEGIRDAVYQQYDTGYFNHVWYQLRPAGNDEYHLLIDASVREKQSQFGLSVNSRIHILKSLQSVSSLNLGFQRYFSGNYLWGISTSTEVSDFPTFELKIFIHPFGVDSMVYTKGYIRVDPLYYFANDSVESIYSTERYGSSFGVKFALLRRVGVTCSGFGEYYRRKLRQGGSYYSEGSQWLYGFSVLMGVDTLDRIIGPQKGIDAECLIESISDTSEHKSLMVKTVIDGYIPLADFIIINPRMENLTLVAGSIGSEVTPALGTALVNYGYFAQEIRGMNVGLAGMRLRFRVASLPLGAGDDIYVQLAGNLAANWDGNIADFSDGEIHGAGAIGMVAVTTLGELEALLCLNSERRFSGFIGLTMSTSFFREP